MRLFFFSFLLFSVFLFSQCSKSKYAAKIPAYILVDTVSLTTQYTLQGSASHKITDVWVYIDDELIGAFELPARFPVLATGEHKLTLKAGIKVNGIANTRTAYPFFTDFTTSIELKEDQITVVQPVFAYSAASIFHWMEDFDEAGITFSYTADSQEEFTIVSAPDAYEGTSSGAIFLSGSKLLFEAYSPLKTLPRGQKPVFLELDYKTDKILEIGLYFDYPAKVNKASLVFLNPSENWNKIYINLTEMLSYNQVSPVHVYFRSNIGSGESSKMYVDNIKLVSF